MIVQQLGALVAALFVLSVELPNRSHLLAVLLPLLLLAGWPLGRRVRAGDPRVDADDGSVDAGREGRTALVWTALALPVLGLALRLDLDRVATPTVPLAFAGSGLALVAALAACSDHARGRSRFALTWTIVVPGLALLAWAWDHGTAAVTSWPFWSSLSPLGWIAGRWSAAPSEVAFGLPWLGPWIGVVVLWIAARPVGER